MAGNQFALLKTKRFLPLFLTQFFGAFNDNVFKNALAVLITYNLSTSFSGHAGILLTLAAALFTLPFFLFSAPAGQLADKYEKAKLIRYIKVAEVFLMLLAGIGLYWHSLPLLFTVLFLLGAQATFFGPLKYSILPHHLHPNELLAGNGFVEAGTYIAILLGTILGSTLAGTHLGPFFVFIAVLLFALLGWFSSFWIPPAESSASHLKVEWNIIQGTLHIMRFIAEQKELYLTIVAISWFWALAATYLTLLPSYTQSFIKGEPLVVAFLFGIFTIGIGVGSLLCNVILRGKVSLRFVPLALLGMFLFGMDLILVKYPLLPPAVEYISLKQFLTYPYGQTIMDFLFLAIAGGLYIVPLYTLLQQVCKKDYCSRVIAGNNIFNAFFMVIAALFSSLLLYLHFSVRDIFLLIALVNLPMWVVVGKIKR